MSNVQDHWERMEKLFIAEHLKGKAYEETAIRRRCLELLDHETDQALVEALTYATLLGKWPWIAGTFGWYAMDFNVGDLLGIRVDVFDRLQRHPGMMDTAGCFTFYPTLRAAFLALGMALKRQEKP